MNQFLPIASSTPVSPAHAGDLGASATPENLGLGATASMASSTSASFALLLGLTSAGTVTPALASGGAFPATTPADRAARVLLATSSGVARAAPTEEVAGAAIDSSRLSRAEEEELLQLLAPWLQSVQVVPAGPVSLSALQGPEALPTDSAAFATAVLSGVAPDTALESEQARGAVGSKLEVTLPLMPRAAQFVSPAPGASPLPAVDAATPREVAAPEVSSGLEPGAPTSAVILTPSGATSAARNQTVDELLAENARPRSAATDQRLTASDGRLLEAFAVIAESSAAGATETQLERAAKRALAVASEVVGGAPRRALSMREAADSAISAVETAEPGHAVTAEGVSRKKNFLADTGEALSRSGTDAGIAVAKPGLFMPHASTPFLDRFAVSAMPVVSDVSFVAVSEAGETLAENAARRAVAVVTAVADAVAESSLQAAPSVALRFKVGHEDLAVRIQLRGGEIRAEFRTDSPELRAAVTEEWRAVSALPTSALRTHEPVFSATSSAGLAGQGDAAPHQGHGGQGQPSPAPFREPSEFFGRVVRPTAPAPVAAPPPALVSGPAPRLSAVA